MRSLSNSSIGSKADQALASFRLSRHNQCQKKNCTGCHLTRLIQPKEYTFICGNPEVQNLKTSKDTSKYTTEEASTSLEQVKSIQQHPVKSKKHSNPYKKSVDLNDLKFFKTWVSMVNSASKMICKKWKQKLKVSKFAEHIFKSEWQVQDTSSHHKVLRSFILIQHSWLFLSIS